MSFSTHKVAKLISQAHTYAHFIVWCRKEGIYVARQVASWRFTPTWTNWSNIARRRWGHSSSSLPPFIKDLRPSLHNGTNSFIHLLPHFLVLTTPYRPKGHGPYTPFLLSQAPKNLEEQLTQVTCTLHLARNNSPEINFPPNTLCLGTTKKDMPTIFNVHTTPRTKDRTLDTTLHQFWSSREAIPSSSP